MFIYVYGRNKAEELKTLLQMREIVQEGTGWLGHKATCKQVDSYEDFLITQKDIGEIGEASNLLIKAINEEIVKVQEQMEGEATEQEADADGCGD